MQMQFFASGAGAQLKGVGITTGQEVYVLFRDAPDEGVIVTKIDGGTSVGGPGSVLGMSAIVTEWFPVNPSRNYWLWDVEDLIGREAAVTVVGGAIGGYFDPRIDINFEVFDRYHGSAHRLERHNLSTVGLSFNLNKLVIHGKLRRQDKDEAYIHTNEGAIKLVDVVESLTKACEKEN